jgi:hypothetical protein
MLRGVLILSLSLVACQSAEGPASGRGEPGGGDAALRSLDAAHAAEFRQTFDDLSGHDRYVVALSPT